MSTDIRKVKVSKLTHAALDLMVSRAGADGGNDGWGWFEQDSEGFLFDPLNECRYSPSTIWEQGGPIIERERICTYFNSDNVWTALIGNKEFNGPTPLIAAMRCFVASKLGDVVDIPVSLLKGN